MIYLFLCALVVVLLGLLVLVCGRIERLMSEVGGDLQHDHAKCMSMVAAFVSDEFAVRVLQAAAREYDTTNGRIRLMFVRDNMWSPDSPSIPALWLRDRAERILADKKAPRGFVCPHGNPWDQCVMPACADA